MAKDTEYKNNWQKEHLDRINVPKGQKDVIQAHATTHGESITAFINRAIRETIERDKHASAFGPAEDNEPKIRLRSLGSNYPDSHRKS